MTTATIPHYPALASGFQVETDAEGMIHLKRQQRDIMLQGRTAQLVARLLSLMDGQKDVVTLANALAVEPTLLYQILVKLKQLDVLDDPGRVVPANQNNFDKMATKPHRMFRHLRASGSLHWVEQLNEGAGGWVIPRYQDVVEALHDERLSNQRSELYLEQFPLDIQTQLKPLHRIIRSWLAFMPPEQHRVMRRQVLPGFKRGFLESVRPQIEAIVDRLLDEVAPAGKMDFMADFAYPLPLLAIAEMMGVPASDLSRFQKWAGDIGAFLSTLPATPEMAFRAQQSFLELTDYFRAQLNGSGQEATAFTTLLLHNHKESIATETMLAQFSALLFGAYRTTSYWLGNSLYTLLRHPHQWQRLLADPSLLRSALVELLRYEPPLPFVVRTVGETHERHGQTLHQGQQVYLLLTSANRDPDKFTNPDRLDIQRREGPHLSFGLGSRGCIGAALAHLEVEVAFQAILRRFPEIQLINQEADWHEGWHIRGLKQLPVLLSV